MEFNEKTNIPKQKIKETIKIIKTTEIIEKINYKVIKNRKILYLFLGLTFLFLMLALIKIHYFLSKSKLSKIIKARRILENKNEYNSFAAKTSSNYIEYLIHGKDYFEDLFESLMEAKESIYIAGFLINPEVFLKRPVNEKIYIDMFKKKNIDKRFWRKYNKIN